MHLDMLFKKIRNAATVVAKISRVRESPLMNRIKSSSKMVSCQVIAFSQNVPNYLAEEPAYSY